jgi:hypothetical protein
MCRARLFAVILPLLPFMSGCIFPYCAYPTLGYTPNVAVGPETSTVHAFRVDSTREGADLGVFDFEKYGGDERFTEVPVTNTDEVPAQLKPAVSYGFVVFGVALNFLTHTSHSIALRLYRPGYEVVEIRSWELAQRVVWRPAPDLAAQEKALDDLMGARRLEPGSAAPAHKKALLFGAAEYERLAAVAQDKKASNRLMEQAALLRKLAEATTREQASEVFADQRCLQRDAVKNDRDLDEPGGG